MSEQLEMVKICKVIEEAESVRTFIFHHAIDFAPGQFIMVCGYHGLMRNLLPSHIIPKMNSGLRFSE